MFTGSYNMKEKDQNRKQQNETSKAVRFNIQRERRHLIHEMRKGVFVCSGCCNKTPQKFFTVLETGKSKIKVLPDSVSGQGPLSGS
jgi:tetraacyldisaccharide-1-P 4'-kinase